MPHRPLQAVPHDDGPHLDNEYRFDPSESHAEDASGPEILFEDISSDSRVAGASGPEILFEDIFGGSQASGGTVSSESPKASKVAPPIPDDQIATSDLSVLSEDQLVWCVGRAATLKISDDSFWTNVGVASKSMGESTLEPASVCRLIQALAYAPKEALLDEKHLQRLLKAFAKRVSEYDDEKLARVIYGYGKLAAKRDLSQQKFFDFASSEVLERSVKLRGWRMNRILQAIWHLPSVSDEFRAALLSQVFKHVTNLDSEALRKFVPMLVDLKFHQRSGVIDKLNTVYKQKVRGWRKAELLLRSGMPMLLNDIMKTATLVAWLQRLHDLDVQIHVADAVEPGHHEADNEPEAKNVDAESTVNSKGRREKCDTHRITENLETLKLVELCLRHERPSVHAVLPPRAIDLLNRARRTPLEPAEDYHMLELPFVFAELRRGFHSLGLLLYPTVFGPYLLELADPLGQSVVEWDRNWALYPPWRRKRHEDFVRRKHEHLRGEGWKVLCVPWTEFQAQEAWAGKIDFLRRFAEQNDLEHLRLTPGGMRRHAFSST